jgi:GNAT superfamily N-acetyltransferase
MYKNLSDIPEGFFVWFFPKTFTIQNMKSQTRITKAQISDAPWIAFVQVKTWQSAYIWQIDDEYLNQLDIWVRQEKWNKILSEPDVSTYVATIEHKVIGFICANMFSQKESYQWEITAIYVFKEFQWMWIWGNLFEIMCHDFRDNAIKDFYLWVLSTNQTSHKFYESMWWIIIDEKEEIIWKKLVKEIAYGFSINS